MPRRKRAASNASTASADVANPGEAADNSDKPDKPDKSGKSRVLGSCTVCGRELVEYLAHDSFWLYNVQLAEEDWIVFTGFNAKTFAAQYRCHGCATKRQKRRLETGPI